MVCVMLQDSPVKALLVVERSGSLPCVPQLPPASLGKGHLDGVLIHSLCKVSVGTCSTHYPQDCLWWSLDQLPALGLFQASLRSSLRPAC